MIIKKSKLNKEDLSTLIPVQKSGRFFRVFGLGARLWLLFIGPKFVMLFPAFDRLINRHNVTYDLFYL